MKDMQRIEILFNETFGHMNRRFDKLEGRFDGLEGRFSGLENQVVGIQADVDEMKLAVARIPFIERKLDRIKLVVGEHSSKLINHGVRIGKLEKRH